MGKKFYLDLLERVAWTFVQGGAAEWIISSNLDATSFKFAGVAGLIAVAKCLLATRVGASNTASTLPLAEDTEKG